MAEDATGILDNDEIKDSEKAKLLLNRGNLGIAIRTKNSGFIQHESTKKVITQIWYGSHANDAHNKVKNILSVHLNIITDIFRLNFSFFFSFYFTLCCSFNVIILCCCFTGS